MKDGLHNNPSNLVINLTGRYFSKIGFAIYPWENQNKSVKTNSIRPCYTKAR